MGEGLTARKMRIDKRMINTNPVIFFILYTPWRLFKNQIISKKFPDGYVKKAIYKA
jgi:hypothetical protein